MRKLGVKDVNVHRILWGCSGIVGSLVLGLGGMLLGSGRAIAQSIPSGVDIPEDSPRRIQEQIDQSTPRPTQPVPIPVESPAPAAPPILESPVGQPAPVPAVPPVLIRVDRIEVKGNTILEAEIAALVQPLENTEVTFEQLVKLRSDITALYTSRGYITSGAFLPNNQNLSDGVVQIQVVEGEIEAIQVEGLQRLNSSYVRSRLQLAGQTPFNQQKLERALQLLQVDPLLRRVNAELTAGSAPGRSVLQVTLQEAPSLNASVGSDNYQPNSIGSAQLSVTGSYANLLGQGDRISVQYGRTNGLNLYDIGYTIPVNPRDGTVTLSYNTNDSRIIEDAVDELDIRSDAQTWSLAFRQPLSRSVTEEFALGLSLDLRRSQTYILDDIPFSFSTGAEDGESKLTVLRFTQDWVRRGRTQVLAARSQFSLGLDAFDATINDTGTDGRFIKWLGQFQWVQQVGGRSLLVTRLNAQLTPDSLLSPERIGLGGQDTVRGYAQNQIVTDNAIWATAEVRLPLTPNSNRLELIPFIDAGHAWNNDLPDPTGDLLIAVGVGLHWQILRGLDLRVDYGIPLVNDDAQGNSLQDNGIYVSLRYYPF